MSDTSKITDRELLIRIDERLKSVERQITAMQSTTIPPSEHAALLLSVKNHEDRLDVLESFKLKVGIYIGLAGAAGGLVFSVFSGFISDLISHVME